MQMILILVVIAASACHGIDLPHDPVALNIMLKKARDASNAVFAVVDKEPSYVCKMKDGTKINLRNSINLNEETILLDVSREKHVVKTKDIESISPLPVTEAKQMYREINASIVAIQDKIEDIDAEKAASAAASASAAAAIRAKQRSVQAARASRESRMMQEEERARIAGRQFEASQRSSAGSRTGD